MAKVGNIIFLLIYASFSFASSNNDIKFEHISVEQGLSHTKVFCIFQDSRGFMWFGTEDGLNKFDGYHFTAYRHDPADSLSLSNNLIKDIYEDKSGKLWIATSGGGINRFDYETESFLRYMYDQDNPRCIPSDHVNKIAGFWDGQKEILWLGSNRGLTKFDPRTEEFTLFSHTHLDYPYSFIQAMVIDSTGKVWVGSRIDGLYKFDPATKQYTGFRYNPDIPHSLSDNRIQSLCWDRSGILWIGVESGLIKYNPKSNRFISIQMDPNEQHATTGNWILSIYEDRSDILWVGTGYGGIKIFDRRTKRFTSFSHNPGDEQSISDNTVMCIFQDETDILWIGTWEGVNKLDPRKTQFTKIEHDPGDSNTLSSNFIWSIYSSYPENKPYLWIGTKTDGLNKLDFVSGKIKRFIHEAGNPNSIPSNFISAICQDHTGNLWMGTYGDGLIKYDPESKEYVRYEYNPEDPESISGNIINCIIEDSSGRIWIGTSFHGLNHLDRFTKKFTRFLHNNDITNIYEDGSGNLWIAAQGLKKLDHKTGKFTTYWHNPTDPSSISSNKPTAIYESFEDGQPVLWVGTSADGLNRFDYQSGKFKTYTINEGLPSNTINGILEDGNGNLWLSTNNGLSQFNPQNETFKNFDVADGLPGNKFNLRVCCKTADSRMFFGGTQGLVAFYPDRLKENQHIPDITITDFQIFNKPVGIKNSKSNLINDNYLLEKHISELQEIKLTYQENVFSFEFAALDYSAPEKNKYAYKMEGVDRDWVYTDASRRFATYTNLDPGEYTFKVKGSNNDGIWNEEGTSIKVIITPPWWKSNWAYTLYVFLFGIFIFGVWHLQTNRLKMKQQIEMKHFEAEKLREVDKLKSHFFANISHEFRTPLTLIKGPVKQMLENRFTGNLKEQYKMILRNSDRLLGLINQILDLSKLESGEIKLKVQKTDIVKYLKGLILSFSSLAERKKVSLKLDIKSDSIVGFVDCDKLEKIVTNLLSNAFKFTPENGEIEISLRMSNKFPVPDSQFQISISNSGKGISSDKLDKIFDRFYQAENNYKKDGEGTGIGLALTRELVEVCYGDISVSSIPDQSTTFIVNLPISKESFKEDEIIDSQSEDLDSLSLRGTSLEEKSEKGMSEIENPQIERREKKTVHEISTPLLLIVEDNSDVANYIYSFMENDYRIMTAENGKIGLEKILDKYPDLIISDIMMPEMDGFELCQKVKSDERISHIPIILLTAKADLDSKLEGLVFGADDYVTKPFEAKELQIRSKNLIEQRRKLREKFSVLIDLKPEDIAASSMDEQLLQRLLTVFEDHMEEQGFGVENLAREIGLSRVHLNRKIQALTNQSARDFIRTLRLQKAARMLRSASGTVSEIAYKVGFNNLSHFSKVFHRHFGKLPSEFSPTEK